MTSKTYEHDIKYGNLLDVMDLEVYDENGQLAKVFFWYLLSDKHQKYLDLLHVDKAVPKSENSIWTIQKMSTRDLIRSFFMS